MNKAIIDVWIGSEVNGSIIGGVLYENDNTDVIVSFNDNSKYVATFFTYENIESLRRKNQKTGECLNGKYFWASDMIIVEKTDRSTIVETIDNLIENDQFNQIFKEIK